MAANDEIAQTDHSPVASDRLESQNRKKIQLKWTEKVDLCVIFQL